MHGVERLRLKKRKKKRKKKKREREREVRRVREGRTGGSGPRSVGLGRTFSENQVVRVSGEVLDQRTRCQKIAKKHQKHGYRNDCVCLRHDPDDERLVCRCGRRRRRRRRGGGGGGPPPRSEGVLEEPREDERRLEYQQSGVDLEDCEVVRLTSQNGREEEEGEDDVDGGGREEGGGEFTVGAVKLVQRDARIRGDQVVVQLAECEAHHQTRRQRPREQKAGMRGTVIV